MKKLLLILALGVLYAQTHSLNFDGENDYLVVNHSEDYTLQEELTVSHGFILIHMITQLIHGF